PTGTVTFADGATILGTVTLSGGTATLRTSALSAGSHGITVRYSGDAQFAASTSAPLTLTVTPAALTVTAGSASRVYGQANPAFAARYGGFVNGDSASSLGGSLTFSTTAGASSPAGSYAVTPGGLTSGNYRILFVGGTLTVAPAPLTVAADDATKVSGQANPA